MDGVTFQMLMPGATLHPLPGDERPAGGPHDLQQVQVRRQPQELDAVEPALQVGEWGWVELSW